MSVAGESACLAAAAMWAVSLILFRGAIGVHGARLVNFAKCLLAALLQGATVLALGQMEALVTTPLRVQALVAASGVIGLVLGDTALFVSVGRIGVHRALLLQTLAPVFTALIDGLWRGVWPGIQQVSGAAMILVGVALVVSRQASDESAARRRGVRAVVFSAGILAGVVAAFGQGAGIVLAKAGMETMSVLPASFLRLAASAAGLALLAVATGRRGGLGIIARSREARRRIVPATLIGTYFAMFLMMAGIAWTPASIAAVLLSTSPVFSLVLEAIIDRRPITFSGAAGTLLAVAGVAMLTLT
jgi:drug/metabolite transporter (DMT)-like permease